MSYLATDALIARCREVLGLGAGKRSLDPHHVKPEFHVGLTDRETSLRALVNPRYDVRVSKIQKIDARGVESISRYTVMVDVVCAYHLETVHRLSASDRDALYGLAHEDSDRINQAFGYEGNLSRASDNRVTWLAGGVLRHVSSTVENTIGDDPNRVFRMTLSYEGVLTVPTQDPLAAPTISGLFAYYRADLGVSATSATITDADDLSTVNWVATGGTVNATAQADAFGNLNAYQFVESGATSQRYLSQSTIGTSVFGSMRTTIEVKGSRFVWLGNATDGVYQTFDVANGRLGSVSIGAMSATMIPLAGDWYRCTLSWCATSSASVQFGMSATDSVSSYAGDGTSSMLFANPTLEDYEIVSAWADQSGGGRHLSQGTAFRSPRFLQQAVSGTGGVLNGGTSLWFGGAVGGQLWASTASDWTFLHNGTGGTIAMACHRPQNPAGSNSSHYWDNVDASIANPGVYAERNIANAVSFYTCDGSSGNGITIQSASNANEAIFYRHGSGVAMAEINGLRDTAAVSSPSASAPLYPFAIGRSIAGTTNMFGFIGELRVYDAEVSDADIILLRSYFGHRYGTA